MRGVNPNSEKKSGLTNVRKYRIVKSSHFGWMLIETGTKKIISRNHSKDKLIKYCENMGRRGSIELTVINKNDKAVETYSYGEV